METAKLVVCDIDNTLVPKHKNLTPKTKEAIEQLQSKGILFGLASGRSISQLHTLEDLWGIRCEVLIGLNGSEIYDGLSDTQESFYYMEPQWIKECLEIMAPFDCNPCLGRNGIHYIRRLDAASASSGAYLKNSNPPHIVKDDSEFYEEPAAKIGFRVKAEDMPEIEKRAAAFSSPYYTGFKTENTMFEFCNAKASKGELLKMFCAKHNIDMKYVYSFGDMTNDISMLEVSGVGVCMQNGSDDAKAAADIITEKGVEEDGWAFFVENHILHRECGLCR